MRWSPPSSAARSIFSLGTPDRSSMETRSSTPSSSSTPALTVDEEYDRAFKSKSFLDLWSNAQQHLRHTFKSSSFRSSSGIDRGSQEQDAAPEPEQSCSYTVLDDFVLEPRPEALGRRGSRGGLLRLLRITSTRNHKRRVESLLTEYFEVTQAACEACSELLAALGAARRHHLTLRRLLLRMENATDDDDARDALADHVRLDNPLSPASLEGFHDAHARCAPLATRLAAAQRRLRRLARAAAIVAAVVFAAHAVVGIGAAAAPAAVGAVRRWAAERNYARAGATVDAAARGAYIVGRDLDTVSRMVRRAHDELEHGRDVARIAVRGNGELPLLLLLQEVAREEAECEADLRAQLEELEEHVCLCLCLITINRTRRMVAHHITPSPLDHTPTTTTTTPQD